MTINKRIRCVQVGPQFSAEHRILSQATEFACFRGISVFAEFSTDTGQR